MGMFVLFLGCSDANPSFLLFFMFLVMQFGASEKYGNMHPTVTVISGTQQVVSGLSYDLKVAVTRKTSAESSSTECTVDKMVVGFQPWNTPKYTLYSFERTAEACP